MEAGRVLRHARRRRSLSQRELARLADVQQPVIARIESGAVTPRVDTLQRLLAVCGESLETRPRLGVGIDRAQIRELLQLTPGERLRLGVQEARNLAKLMGDRD